MSGRRLACCRLCLSTGTQQMSSPGTGGAVYTYLRGCVYIDVICPLCLACRAGCWRCERHNLRSITSIVQRLPVGHVAPCLYDMLPDTWSVSSPSMRLSSVFPAGFKKSEISYVLLNTVRERVMFSWTQGRDVLLSFIAGFVKTHNRRTRHDKTSSNTNTLSLIHPTH